MSTVFNSESLPILEFLDRKVLNKPTRRDETPFTYIGYQIIEKKFVVYKFQTYYNGTLWHLQCRYSELETLRKKSSINGTPQNFPSKQYFGNLKPDFVEMRAQGLQHFLNKTYQQRSRMFDEDSSTFLAWLNDKRAQSKEIIDMMLEEDFKLDA